MPPCEAQQAASRSGAYASRSQSGFTETIGTVLRRRRVRGFRRPRWCARMQLLLAAASKTPPPCALSPWLWLKRYCQAQPFEQCPDSCARGCKPHLAVAAPLDCTGMSSAACCWYCCGSRYQPHRLAAVCLQTLAAAMLACNALRESVKRFFFVHRMALLQARRVFRQRMLSRESARVGGALKAQRRR